MGGGSDLDCVAEYGLLVQIWNFDHKDAVSFQTTQNFAYKGVILQKVAQKLVNLKNPKM